MVSSTDKIEVIDLIISVLREHEDSLDGLVSRLERLNRELGKSFKKENDIKEIEKDETSITLDLKIKELENNINNYRKILKSLLNHCDNIKDVACIKIIANESLKK
jgi:hypothetical protein